MMPTMPPIGEMIERRFERELGVAQLPAGHCSTTSSASVTCTAVTVFEFFSALTPLDLGLGVAERDLGAVERDLLGLGIELRDHAAGFDHAARLRR